MPYNLLFAPEYGESCHSSTIETPPIAKVANAWLNEKR
jgi:hypothetical protein